MEPIAYENTQNVKFTVSAGSCVSMPLLARPACAALRPAGLTGLTSIGAVTASTDKAGWWEEARFPVGHYVVHIDS